MRGDGVYVESGGGVVLVGSSSVVCVSNGLW